MNLGCFLLLESLNKMQIYVISGGPGVGKTSIINELAKDYFVLEEAARAVGDSQFKGKSVKQINQFEFQKAIFEFQKKEIENFKNNKIIFSDRGFGDTLAYYSVHHLKAPKEIKEYAKKFRYTKIFILKPLKFYKKDKLRQETEKEQKRIHKIIVETYRKLGYKLIFVPFMSIEDRVKFIKSNIL